MPRPLPSRTERMVRSVLLLLASALLTLLAWALGLYQSQDSTRVSIIILVIIVVAVVISRFGAKLVMRHFGGGRLFGG